MATGTYGTIRPADMSPSDVDITVFYSENRETTNTTVFKLDSSNLQEIENPINATTTGGGNTRLSIPVPVPEGFEIFGGLYKLNLPVDSFSSKGIYSIVFKPVEIRTKIVDCGVLSAFPDVKGIVLDGSDPNLNTFVDKLENNNLIGYRIEYLNSNRSVTDRKLRNFFKIVTSNNRSEPINQNITNTSQKAIRYRFNDNSTLVFCTVSPSSSSNVTPNVLPFIGSPNQDIIITNTFFSPFVLELELVDYDIESLAIGLFGNQTKSLEDGIYTIYNFNTDIYKQYNIYEIKDRFTGKPLFEIKEDKLNNIDFTKAFNNISSV